MMGDIAGLGSTLIAATAVGQRRGPSMPVCYLSVFGEQSGDVLVLSLTAVDPSGHSEAFTRLAYRP